MPKNNAAEVIQRLERIGITYHDAANLRRIAMTLHTWHEAECGTGNGCVERNEATGKPYWLNSRTGNRMAVPDREKGALKRLADVMARYPTLRAYIQGDPRGAPLFILKPGDVPEDGTDDAYYSRGVAVYK